MRRRWRLRPCPSDAVDLLREELALSPLLATLLASRGITEKEPAQAFLHVRLSEHLRSPMLFRQMPVAADRVIAALGGGERIGIYGDYDVDGISGTAVLVRFLRALGHEPLVYIPHRMRDGYGVQEPGVRWLAEAGARLMITVDCGGCSHTEIRLASELGMDTIVCDHHQVSGTPLPAHAVLNPIEPDAGFPFAGLCGAGVAFYLALGVRMRLREQGRTDLPDLRRWLGLVTLGTIADIVPLLAENRAIVRHGLKELMQTGAPGIVALKAVSSVTSVNSGVVGFRLAPRLNAAGRLSDARRGVELLTTDDPEVARRLATELDDENRERQGIEREILADALARMERAPDTGVRRSIVMASTDWHSGVIGIVAARLIDRYHLPTVLIAVDPATGVGRGSGRSISKLNLHAAFRRCEDLVLGFGGHHMAAGLSISEDRVAEFAERFESVVTEMVPADGFEPELLVDTEIGLDEVHETLLADLEKMEPFGAGNPQPLFLLRQVQVASRRIVGENHLKLLLRQGKGRLSAIGFGMAAEPFQEGEWVDLVASFHRNEWNGSTSIDAHIRDIRKSKEI